MSQSPPACPSCHSESVSFNGHTRHGKQNHKCRNCGRQFVLNPQWHPLTQEQRDTTRVDVTNKLKKRLTVQLDELWSFVDKKGNEQWVWLALDAETREIVGPISVTVAVSQLRPSGCPYPRYIDNVL